MKNVQSREAAIAQAKKDWADYVAAKQDLDQRIQELVAKEQVAVTLLRGRVATSFHNAVKAGVPKTTLAKEVMEQKGTVLTYQLIQEGADLAGRTVNPEANAAPFVKGGAGVVTYTPTDEEFTAAATKLGLDAETAPRSAEFKVKNGRVTAVTEAFGEGGMHPVVALVMADGSKHAKALVEFAS